MVGRFGTICISAAALPLAACASFEGAPRPVLDLQKVTVIDPAYYPSTALIQIQAEQDKVAYRNRVMAIYMAAMDARYAAFRMSLSRQLRGTNFGLELATLGIGGIGSVWAKAAQEINAGTTFLTGSKGAFNKEVYFQQTLPALVGMMDANRLKVAADLIANQSKTIEQYPLEAAFSDLARYELSGTIDSAVQELTQQAAAAVDSQRHRFANLTRSCGPTREAGDLRTQIIQKAYRSAGLTDLDDLPPSLAANSNPGELALLTGAVTGTPEQPAEDPEQAAAQIKKLTDVVTGICDSGRLRTILAL